MSVTFLWLSFELSLSSVPVPIPVPVPVPIPVPVSVSVPVCGYVLLILLRLSFKPSIGNSTINVEQLIMCANRTALPLSLSLSLFPSCSHFVSVLF